MTTKRVRFYQILGKAHFKQAHTGIDGTVTYNTSGGETVTKPRKTERAAFLDASGKEPLQAIGNTFYTPENVHDRKPCSRCKSSKLLKMFTKITKRNGLVIYHSWCNECRAEWSRVQYHDADKLTRFP